MREKAGEREAELRNRERRDRRERCLRVLFFNMLRSLNGMEQ